MSFRCVPGIADPKELLVFNGAESGLKQVARYGFSHAGETDRPDPDECRVDRKWSTRPVVAYGDEVVCRTRKMSKPTTFGDFGHDVVVCEQHVLIRNIQVRSGTP
jgi:hypothetical protein